MATRSFIFVLSAFLLGGCMHVVTYGVDAGAHWKISPSLLDVK